MRRAGDTAGCASFITATRSSITRAGTTPAPAVSRSASTSKAPPTPISARLISFAAAWWSRLYETLAAPQLDEAVLEDASDRLFTYITTLEPLMVQFLRR